MSNKNEGIRIDHNYDELESGSTYIMVPKDVPLIDPKGTLQEGPTELENIELQAAHKQKIKLRLKEEVKRGTTYDPYRNAMEGDKEAGLYQDPNDKKEGILLDESGQYDPHKVAQLASIKQKLTKTKANEISLETPKVFASEYEVPAEPPKGKRKLASTMTQKRRKIDQEDIADLLAKNQGVAAEPDVATKEEVRKKAGQEQEAKEAGEELEKSQKYRNAVKRAKKITADVYSAAGKDEYDEIEAAINSQRLALSGATRRGEDLIQQFIQEDSAAPEGEALQKVDAGNGGIGTKPTEDEGGVLITDALHFIKAVPSMKDRKEYKQSIMQNTNLSLKDTRDGRASVVNVPLPTERLRYLAPGYSSCVPAAFPAPATATPAASAVAESKNVPSPAKEGTTVATKEPAAEAKNTPVATTETPAEVAPLDEALVGKGVGNCLKILRERKLLGQTMYAGRSKDATKEKELEKYQKAGVKGGEKFDFDYRDEFGNKLTLKEAWRYQSRIFHGLRPSKKKREKTMIKREKERKKLTMDQVKDSKLSQALVKTQQEKVVAYMVLDAKKPVIF